MEYCSYSLSKLRKTLKKTYIPWPRCLHFMQQSMSGVDLLHHNKFIHRDIKPENIMDTDSFVCNIADLGLAKHESSHTNLNKDSISIQPSGSMLYISPERWNSPGDPAEESDDIDSCGMVFFKMITNANLFYSWADSMRNYICDEVNEEDLAKADEKLKDLLEGGKSRTRDAISQSPATPLSDRASVGGEERDYQDSPTDDDPPTTDNDPSTIDVDPPTTLYKEVSSAYPEGLTGCYADGASFHLEEEMSNLTVEGTPCGVSVKEDQDNSVQADANCRYYRQQTQDSHLQDEPTQHCSNSQPFQQNRSPNMQPPPHAGQPLNQQQNPSHHGQSQNQQEFNQNRQPTSSQAPPSTIVYNIAHIEHFHNGPTYYQDRPPNT